MWVCTARGTVEVKWSGIFFLLWNPGVLPHFLLVLPLYVLMVMVMVILILIGKKKNGL